jgi:hypothetical protein
MGNEVDRTTACVGDSKLNKHTKTYPVQLKGFSTKLGRT